MTPPFQREASLLSLLFGTVTKYDQSLVGQWGCGGRLLRRPSGEGPDFDLGRGSCSGRDPSRGIRDISTPLQSPSVHLWPLSTPPLSIIPAYREVWAVRSAQMCYPIIFLSALGAYLKPSREWSCSGEKTCSSLPLTESTSPPTSMSF